MQTRTLALSLAASLALAHAAAADSAVPSPRDQEIALALEAAPPAVAAKAGVYVHDKTGYVKARDSQNGFVCVVDHRIPAASEPQCMDEEGVKTFLPKYLLAASLRASGKSEPQIREAIAEAFKSGALKAPAVEVFSGLMLPLIAGSLPDFAQPFEQFAKDLERAATA
ncbi:MAG: hypothetical protein JST92_18180 [Deltaproteobacteria bacterium]|nr:hypothetical protein [Deltaproteobacteria bacterium]